MSEKEELSEREQEAIILALVDASDKTDDFYCSNCGSFRCVFLDEQDVCCLCLSNDEEKYCERCLIRLSELLEGEDE